MKILYVLSATALLGGCVSSSDMDQTNSQVNRLNSKIALLENQLKAVQTELTAVKGQRVVRLPTGAPTEIEPRQSRSVTPAPTLTSVDDAGAISETPNTAVLPSSASTAATASVATPQPTVSQPTPTANDQTLFRQAMAAHQAGSSEQALATLNLLLRDYPDSTYRPNALLGVGQINYQLRRFSQAELPLETLVMNTPASDITRKASNLLKRVYVAQNKQAKLYELEGFLQNTAPVGKTTNGIMQ